ncbi:ATP-grasp domain-containing protein [Candidatus Symbiobacter mobilis]|uniref:Carbamoyl phosphate synthase ATP-binding domain-containing protein n=1 Tax=Candidatus Symbiobacter mobilis CR TaxID=946483 RepID=U5N6U2_9BURK|nr:ATP-grasp domain-containing protein [Candidatus Symbiobacter mobilis]AGX87256.1 hypothetical protein Cenrod_1163 [Candidatus Symbiobacter mobilis CR]
MRVWFNKTFSLVHTALRLLRTADPDQTFTLLASHPNPDAIVRLAADEFSPEPPGQGGAEYVDWCLGFCQQHRVDIFVPGKEATLLAGAQDRFAALGVRMLCCADGPTLQLLHDKARFCSTVRVPTAPPPLWHPCTTVAEFDEAWDALRGSVPTLCIKPSHSVYGIGFRKIRQDTTALGLYLGGSDYQIDLPSLRAILASQERFPTLLLMEYLAGDEFSIDCLAEAGTLHYAVIRCKPAKGGSVQTIVDRPDLEEACRAIIAQFGLNGYVNVQCREGGAGPRILEVNPRMSGGIGMSCLAGPNLPFLGLAGFAHGYATLARVPVQHGLRVVQIDTPVVLP